MCSTVSKNVQNSLSNLFDIIQTPTYNLLTNKYQLSNHEIINSLDLNITTFRKYYPKVTSILKNNPYYNKDLVYNFMNIRSMSTYIFNRLDEMISNYYDENIKEYLDLIYEYMFFVDNLLEDFHNILNIKNDLIKNKINNTEFNLAYIKYEDKLNKNMEYFYENIYNDEIDDKYSQLIKDIWSREYVEGEYEHK